MSERERLLLELLLCNECMSDKCSLLEAVLDVADVLVVVLDRAGRIVRFNRACEQATGYSAEEARGKVPWDFLIPPEQVPGVRRAFVELIQGADGNRSHNEWTTRRGDRVRVEWSNTVLRGVDGAVRNVVGTGLDVTAQWRVESSLEHSESREAAIIAAAVEGIVVIGEDRRIELANPSLHAMLGYENGELLGEPFERLIPERFQERHQGFLKAFLERPTPLSLPASLGIRARRKDGSEFPAQVSVGCCDSAGSKCAVAMVSDRSESERQRQELEESRDRVRRLAASLLAAETNEDRRIARDLHDGLVQDLAALSIELGILAYRPYSSVENLLGEVRSLEAKAKALAEEARDWSHKLHPATVENLGLGRSIGALCASVQRRRGIPVTFSQQGAVPELPLQEAMAVYRIVQEALRNAVNHSGADRVDVRLDAVEDEIRIEVRDAGSGFDLRSERLGGGLGMVTMEERARLIGGALDVDTTPGSGTLVRLSAPTRSREP